ncbi:hypothetical protein BD324DRAFT_613614 [Kockovaella imperatae]|uniref:SNF5-domain-containing protein n=1 Tax=Kockovaella imperatae TaxID=4999 RepID=A0A1Y1UT55_9TREE|nr:hypothetical protein BD324DRAFT_613614 [Kockovaella imperatae]ORX41203.1 hypothetical protein BD324DRAFT_613614 [Kockovaella imperatae]
MQAFAQGKPQQMQQQQQQQQPVQPPQPPQTAQPSGEADTSDFPFDFRLLHMIPALADPGWRAMIQTHQPQTFAAVSHAAAVLNTGTVPVDTLNRMKQMASLMRAPPQNQSGQQKPRSRPVSQHGTAPPNVRPPPPPATQPPVRPPIAQPVPRPQPPHLAGSVPPQSPAISDASQQSSRRQKDRKPEPVTVDPGMPPPAWIPTQPTPTTRPSTAGRDAVRGSGLPVKEWESALPLPLPIHTITTLPEEDPDDPTFGGLLPPLSQEEQKSIKNWIANDQAYAQKLGETKGKNREKMSRWARSLEFQTPWWEIRKGETPLPPRTRISILFPEEKMALRARARGRREVRFSPAQLKALANVDDQIIPVRIDLEQDHWKLKDTFMWNCADTVVTPELFAATLCLDFGVPEGVFGPRIVAAIREREREFQNQVLPILARNAMDGTRGKMDSEGNADAKATFEVFRRAREGSLPVLEDDQGSQMAHSARSSVEIKTEVGEDDERIKIVGLDAEVIADEEDAVKKEEKPMTVEEATATFSSVQSEDLRFLIKVDIILGTQNLTDTFEWDLNSVVTPEEFAALHVKELGLSGEFATALAHDIHEQILVHRRSLFLVGHMPGSGVILDDEVRSAFLPPITKSSLLRREDVALATFTPIFATMTEQEINEIEKDRDRDAKRKKRNTRGRRGVVLPDREPIKTHRTLINPMGPNGQLPVVSATEDVSAPVATTSRRAAAIAAQANISVLAQDLEMPSPPTPPAAALPTPSVFNKMSMRNSRPPTNRYSRGASRASPSSAREDSMVPNGEYGTPTMAGSKRSLYDDSVSESVGSPMPSRKRPFNGQFDSPDGNAFNVKMEAPYGETKVPWRCKNCGVPEHLSRGVKRDVRNGEWSLCLQCYRYYSKRRRPRPCTYTEDEETHRLRLENTGPGNPNGVPAGMPRTQQKPEPMSAPQPSPQQPPHFMGNGHGYAPPNHGYPPPQPMSFPDMSSGQTNPHHVPAHVQAPPAPVQPSQPPPPPQDSAKDPSQSPSDSDSDSESRDSVDTPPPPLSNKPFSTPGPPPPVPSAPPLSARSVSATSATMPSPVTSKKPMPDPPSWTNRAQAELRAKYPLDSFIIVPKLRPADQPSAPLEWRIKCTDCPGKVYTLGPGETLDNFEVHLRNRQHVEKRTAARAARGR